MDAHETDAAPPAGAADKPVAELLAEAVDSVGTLVRRELELAVVELSEEMRQAARAGGALGAGAVAGYLSVLFGCLGLAWALDRRLPRPLAFLVVAGGQGAAAAALLKWGRQELLGTDPVPSQTVETLKETAQWARDQAG